MTKAIETGKKDYKCEMQKVGKTVQLIDVYYKQKVRCNNLYTEKNVWFGGYRTKPFV